MYTPPHLTIGNGEHHVVVVHGWLGDLRSYAPTWRLLDRQRFTYAFMDARGYGAAKGVAGEFTIGEFAADIVGLADALGWDRFSIVGHSMGAMAAQRVLCTARDRVRSIVGVTPVAASGAQFDEAGWSIFSQSVTDPAFRRQVFEITTAGRSTPTWVTALVEDSLVALAPEALQGYLRSHANDGFSDEIVGADTPVLALVGENDVAVPREAIDKTFAQWYPNLRIETLAGSSHYPADEVPVALVTAVENFLGAQR
jgi:pimeloyl-ACP methyl ester carboxylesterase